MGSRGWNVTGVIEDGGLTTPRSLSPIPSVGTNAAVSAEQRADGAALGIQAVRDAARRVLREALSEQRQYLDPFYTPADERNRRVIQVLRDARAEHLQRGGELTSVPNDNESLLRLYRDTIGWGPAQRYLDDPRVQEIKINGTEILVQESGRPFVHVPERFDSAEEVTTRVVNLADLMGIKLNSANPQTTIPAAHGTRIHATIAPRSATPLVCLRRGRSEAWDLEDVLRHNSISQPIAELLHLLCQAHCSFLIAGATGSGKTGLLEALANSWPGDPHIISIEDQTAEIGIRRQELWTKQVVDTTQDAHAFISTATESLRQTPDLLLPGELRGHAAGPVLWMSLTGHATITTLHADSCGDAILRFAAFASDPAAYMYGGRYSDALRDTCSAFPIVVYMAKLPALGLRVIAEIAAVDGIYEEHGMLYPRVIPLAEMQITSEGTIDWQLKVRVTADHQLTFLDGQTQIPTKLQAKLQAAHMMKALTTSTTLDAVQEASVLAEKYLANSEVFRAMATLRNAWTKRRDPRLLTLAQTTLAYAPDLFSTEAKEAAMQWQILDLALVERRWEQAQQQYQKLITDIAQAAAAQPPQGWNAVQQQITEGLDMATRARAACIAAESAVQNRQPRVALDKLQVFEPDVLRVDLAVQVLRLREQAHEQLVATGEGNEVVLRIIRDKRRQLEQVRLEPTP